ncbi:hypothetical protein M1466_03530 [Candidatus Dependentiae bacterium]|nr:hypothetical protein [Candidatus Dependentiae bacterium]
MINKKLQLLAIGLLLLIGNCLAVFDVNDLYFAVLDGDLQAVKSFPITEVSQKEKNVALQNAIANAGKVQNPLDIVQYLVENGADVRADRDAALAAAIDEAEVEILDYLVKQGSDPRIAGDQPLKRAVRQAMRMLYVFDNPYLPIIAKLVRLGADTHVLTDAQKAFVKEHVYHGIGTAENRL